jgi:hypothetical protein
MNAAEAKKAVVGDIIDTTGTLDATADALILRVAQFFGECVRDEAFCGLSIDETRDATGKLTSMKLVPCDLRGGEPERREGRFALVEPNRKAVLLS